MKDTEILRQRLINQQIGSTILDSPAAIVRALVAMQAQEYAMAKWAIGLRLPAATNSMVEKVFNSGDILRTHLLRPTWHFVSPADIRWLLRLTAPRVHTANAFMYRQLELDSKLFKKSNDILVKELTQGDPLTRTELQKALEQRKIIVSGHRLAYLIMYAELEGLICSGPLRGKQFTYALLDNRAAPAKTLHQQEALQILTQRYFTSRGPASMQDFTTWSGLTTKDAKEGIFSLPSVFQRELIGTQEYIYLPAADTGKEKIQSSFLMPDYDEYGMSYKDRTALFNPRNTGQQPVWNRMLVIDGRIEGSWQRTVKGKNISVEIRPLTAYPPSKEAAVKKAVRRFISFHDTVE